MKTIYISGPITDPETGQPREGWQRDFQEAEEMLLGMGFCVINPTTIAEKTEFYWRAANHIRDGRPMPAFEELPPIPRWFYLWACIDVMSKALCESSSFIETFRPLMRFSVRNGYEVPDSLAGLYVIGNPDDIRRSYGTMTEINFALSAGLPVWAKFLHGRQTDNRLRLLADHPTLAEMQKTLNE